MVVQELSPALKIRVKRGVKADMLAVRPAKSCSPQRTGRQQLEASSVEDTVVTINDIFTQCASTELASSAMQPREVFLLDDVEFARAWHAFTAWLKDETSAHRCVQVPGLGVLSFRLFPLGIRIPTFELSEAYLDHHGLSQEQNFSSRQVHNAGEGPPVRFDARLIADAAGLSAACAAFAIDSVLYSIGVAAASGCTLWIDFRVGVLAGRRRFLKFSYVQGVDSLRLMSVPHRPTSSCSRSSTSNNKGVGAGGAFAASGKYYIPGTARAVQAEAKAEQRSAAAVQAAVAAAEQSLKRTEPVCGEAELPVESSALLRSWQPGKGSHSRSPLSTILSHSSSAAVQQQQQGAVQQQQSTNTAKQSPTAAAKGIAAQAVATAAYVACGASPLQDDYPALIDVHARLAAAVLSCASGSRVAEVHGVEKIGRYFSPTAAALSLDHVTHSVIWSSDHGGDAGPPQSVHPFAAARSDRSSITSTAGTAASAAAAAAAAAAVHSGLAAGQKADVSATSALQRQERLHRRRPTTAPAGAAVKRRTLRSSIPAACSSSSSSSSSANCESESDVPAPSSEELDSLAAYLHYLQHDAVLQASVLPLQDSWVKAVLNRALQPGRCGVTAAYTAAGASTDATAATATAAATAAAVAVGGSTAALSASYSKGLSTAASTAHLQQPIRTVLPATPWRASLTSLPPHLADCARGVLAAAESTYELSIRRSILNYVLLCPQQGELDTNHSFVEML
jgi:hypothetical protein